MEDITTRHHIETVINHFYTNVKNDDLLSPVFNNTMHIDWAHHLPIMYDFWETVLLFQPKYSGSMIEKHIAVDRKIPLSDAMFERWVALFSEAVDANCQGENAERAKFIARTNVPIMKSKIEWSKK